MIGGHQENVSFRIDFLGDDSRKRCRCGCVASFGLKHQSRHSDFRPTEKIENQIAVRCACDDHRIEELDVAMDAAKPQRRLLNH